MKTELPKTSPNRYTVVIDGEDAGEVWNWHGSWSVGVVLAASPAGQLRSISRLRWTKHPSRIDSPLISRVYPKPSAEETKALASLHHSA